MGNCLGVIMGAVQATLSVPNKKSQEHLDNCASAVYNFLGKKKELQSVIGCLMFIAKCIKPTRFYVNRPLEDNNKKLIPNSLIPSEEI